MAEIVAKCGTLIQVDDSDFEELNKLRWYVVKRAGCRYAEVRIMMHRLIKHPGKDNGLLIDHKDGDGLNNRRDNLRIATTSENGKNRAKMKLRQRFDITASSLG